MIFNSYLSFSALAIDSTFCDFLTTRVVPSLLKSITNEPDLSRLWYIATMAFSSQFSFLRTRIESEKVPVVVFKAFAVFKHTCKALIEKN